MYITAALCFAIHAWAGSNGFAPHSFDARNEIAFELHSIQTQETELASEYAQWSRLAFHEAGGIYTILGYQYLGRTNSDPGVAQQAFRFWVKKNNAEFPLVVSIRYNPITGKMYTLEMEQERRENLLDL